MASITPINTATDTPSSAAAKTNANELAINTELETNTIATGLNTAKTGITTDQANDIIANNAKPTLTSTDTLVNKTLTSPVVNTPVLNNSISGTAFLDEDDMVSNSNNKVASQQSIKAYVDAQGGSTKPVSFNVNELKKDGVTYSDEVFNVIKQGNTSFVLSTPTMGGISNDVNVNSSTWTDADNTEGGTVILGDYIYIGLKDEGTTPDTFRIYRYNKSDVTAAGTLMSFSGSKTLSQTNFMTMTSDGTNFYFNFDAGNSSNLYDFAKYTLSGTTFTYVSTITLSDNSTYGDGYGVDVSGNIFTQSNGVFKKYNSSGVLQLTRESDDQQDSLLNIGNTFYTGEENDDLYIRVNI